MEVKSFAETSKSRSAESKRKVSRSPKRCRSKSASRRRRSSVSRSGARRLRSPSKQREEQYCVLRLIGGWTCSPNAVKQAIEFIETKATKCAGPVVIAWDGDPHAGSCNFTHALDELRTTLPNAQFVAFRLRSPKGNTQRPKGYPSLVDKTSPIVDFKEFAPRGVPYMTVSVPPLQGKGDNFEYLALQGLRWLWHTFHPSTITVIRIAQGRRSGKESTQIANAADLQHIITEYVDF